MHSSLSCLALLSKFWGALHIDIAFESFPAYLGYVLVGYLIRKIGDIKKWVVISVIGLVASTGYTIYLTFIATRSADKLIGKYYGYTAINIVVVSLCAFILLKFAGEFLETKSRPWYPKLVTTLSEASFGIYLIHIIVIYWLRDGTLDFTLYAFTFHPIFAIPLVASMVFLISFAIIYPIQKVPVLEKIV